jgi:hypothetical protein
VLLGDLVDGLHATKRLQAKLGLELGWMKPTLFLFQSLVTHFFGQCPT